METTAMCNSSTGSGQPPMLHVWCRICITSTNHGTRGRHNRETKQRAWSGHEMAYIALGAVHSCRVSARPMVRASAQSDSPERIAKKRVPAQLASPPRSEY
ncbi:hypothetical protein C8Q78DRAFT_1022774 [Trametes maxima]|nr:hypothetical protein C8Q78DRAFT_1022774 [Trametes maxima]